MTSSLDQIELSILKLAVQAFAETLCFNVAQRVVRAHGKELTKDVARLGVGKRPLECWTAVNQELNLPASAQQLVDASEPELREGVQLQLLRHARSIMCYVYSGRRRVWLLDTAARVRDMHQAWHYVLCVLTSTVQRCAVLDLCNT